MGEPQANRFQPGLIKHGTAGRKLKKLVRAELSARAVALGSKVNPIYGLREAEGATGQLPTKADCMNYLKQFLDTCDGADKVSWVKIELSEKFPLNKWKAKP